MLTFFMTLLGLCIGSFLNVCIYRIPQGMSVITPRSFCPNCKAGIPWFSNLPVFSFLIQRGLSTCCKGPIAYRYLCIEILCACLFFINFHTLEWDIALSNSLFMSLLVVIAMIDLDYMYIPDSLNLGGLLCSFILALLWPFFKQTPLSLEGLYSSLFYSLLPVLSSACISAGMLFLIACFAEQIFKKEALGLGDVKLLALIGSYCSYAGALWAIFIGSCMALIILGPVLLYQKIAKKALHGSKQWTFQCQLDPNLLEQKSNRGSNIYVPFGPWLALGAIIYMIFFIS